MVREDVRTRRADVPVFFPLASPNTLYLYRASSVAATTAGRILTYECNLRLKTGDEVVCV